MKWIVGLDGSDGSIAALRWAAATARRRGERVEPVATWSVSLPVWAKSGLRAVSIDRDAYRASVESAALGAIELIDDSDVVDAPKLVEGNAADVLASMAGPQSTLVVGQRGLGGLRKRILGSVSQYLATHATGPVVVVPAGWSRSEWNHAVVGYDGSRHADAALRWTISLAPDDSTITALVAIDAVPWLSPELVEQRHSDVVAEQRAKIISALDLVDAGSRAERSVVLHSPRQALAEALSEADLVAIGPRGHSVVTRAVLGSTTTWLLHDAGCPIAVVPSI
jgi:nucleotide-binding universal stress UspA family protein